MTIRALIIVLGAVSISAAAPIPPEDEKTKLARAYGLWDAPQRDCSYVLKGGELRIALPAANRVFGKVRTGAMDDAPRVLREVEGDFSAVVRVTVTAPKGDGLGSRAYRSGGLLAWESDRKHFILRQCAGDIDDNRLAVWCHFRGDSNEDRMQRLRKPEDAAYLRLARTGTKLVASWSRDGKLWKEFGAPEVTWGTKLKVGVVAENCTGTATEITFDEFAVTRPEK
jgi:regulation of enolase protein 1 (concanavalin A-like superfamily)